MPCVLRRLTQPLNWQFRYLAARVRERYLDGVKLMFMIVNVVVVERHWQTNKRGATDMNRRKIGEKKNELKTKEKS